MAHDKIDLYHQVKEVVDSSHRQIQLALQAVIKGQGPKSIKRICVNEDETAFKNEGKSVILLIQINTGQVVFKFWF